MQIHRINLTSPFWRLWICFLICTFVSSFSRQLMFRSSKKIKGPIAEVVSITGFLGRHLLIYRCAGSRISEPVDFHHTSIENLHLPLVTHHHGEEKSSSELASKPRRGIWGYTAQLKIRRNPWFIHFYIIFFHTIPSFLHDSFIFMWFLPHDSWIFIWFIYFYMISSHDSIIFTWLIHFHMILFTRFIHF